MATVGTGPQADRDQVEAGIRTLLRMIGEDPSREGLLDTPRRVVDALLEETAGTLTDPSEVLRPIFTTENDEMVVVSRIPFVSLCEHHLMPFWGHVSVGYVPRDGKILGLSKIPRLVEILTRRVQIQERLTDEIAQVLASCSDLSPLGVGVVVSARHSCMEFRGVRSPGVTVTSRILGVIRDLPEARAEFLDLIDRGE